ncbi:MAG: M23 family metallopeptidase [Methylococcaceae bacterium]|nr:M23 family metallopeptidase [Methylococcaceae bacterium]
MKKILFFLAICLLHQPLPVQAKKLYKYKDEQGHWHFSDRSPKTNLPVEVRQLKASHKRFVWLEKTGDIHKPKYFAINNYYGPVEIEVSIRDKHNVYSKPELPKHFVVEPGQSEDLFQMTGIDGFKSWSYSLQYSYIIGSPFAVHDNHAVYSPPFANNEKFFISQAFNGEFSHTDKQNQYAVDLVMPINTSIHAARSGMVMEVNNDFFNSGTEQAYKSRANSIRILHNDGSMAVYAHLVLERAQVFPGLTVSAGQLIGYSGNTGFSSGPHLHFAVQVNKGMELVSVPFKFMGADKIAKEPVAGTWLDN